MLGRLAGRCVADPLTSTLRAARAGAIASAEHEDQSPRARQKYYLASDLHSDDVRNLSHVIRLRWLGIDESHLVGSAHSIESS
jgi:hypothetical protein